MQRQSVRNLPANKNPTGTRCIQITIPDDDDWERDLYGEVYRLALWMLWERDLGHFGKSVADRWRTAIDTWTHCPPQPKPLPGGLLEDFEMPLRVDCDCNVFVTCCDGTEKQILTSDQVKALVQGQPSTGQPQPQPGGGCQTYSGALSANEMWLLPTVVNTGDTIQIGTINGITNDGTGDTWRCAGGEIYFGFACVPLTTITSGSDPLPTVPHQKLIAKINGTYYDFYGSSPFTIPSGISNAQVQLQINVGNRAICSGNLQFAIEVCNNQAASWTSVFDFTLNSYASLFNANQGSWTPGVGWEGIPGTGGEVGTYFTMLATGVAVTSMSGILSASDMHAPHGAAAFFSDVGYYNSNQSPQIGSNLPIFATGPSTLNHPGFQVFTSSTTATCAIHRWEVSGTGTKPVDWP